MEAAARTDPSARTLAHLPELLSTPPRLASALARLHAEGTWTRWGRLPGHGEPYGRQLLHQDATGEVMLARWSGALACAAHDHGVSRGAVLVLEGTFEEVRYRMRDGALQATSRRRVGPGALLWVDEHLLHAMRPDGAGATLHVYAPAVHGMQVFDDARGQLVRVAEDQGAWIVRDQATSSAWRPGGL
ncbi:MAG TPA: cysteine dioxygenase family protein [Polyangiales bacterium]